MRVPIASRLIERPWLLASVVWLLPTLFAAVQASLQWRLHGWDPPSWRQWLFSGGDWLVYALVTPIIFAVSHRWPVQRPRIARHLWLHIGFAVLFCVCWAVSGKLLDVGLAWLFEPTAFARLVDPSNRRTVAIDVVSWILTTLPFGVIVYFCIAGMAHAFDFFMRTAERERQLAKMSEQLADARLAALQSQVNPHFLFNTLNTVIVRARDGDTAGTVDMVERLSALLRRTLDRGRGARVALADELDLVNQYVAIEQARFSDRLRVEMDLAHDALPIAVPGFSVQHLVENAIRHGIARKADAGRVTISARRDNDHLVIVVSDDGPGVTSEVTPPSRGLWNTRERLRALYGDEALLSIERGLDGGTVATLRVPWRAHVESSQ